MEYHEARTPQDSFPLTIEHTVLWADRDKTATRRKFESKTSRKEARGKTLNYSTESAEVRRGLNASRMDEWEEWQRFQTGHLIREDRTPLNQITGDDDRRKPDAIRSAVEQFSMLEGIPLLGAPVTEVERVRQRLRILRAARAAIRNLYIASGYHVESVLVQILRNEKGSAGVRRGREILQRGEEHHYRAIAEADGKRLSYKAL